MRGRGKPRLYTFFFCSLLSGSLSLLKERAGEEVLRAGGEIFPPP